MFDIVSGFAGMILSLAFSYIPKLKDWFSALDGDRKRLVMLASLAVASLGVVGLSCSGFGVDFGLDLTCDRSGFIQVFIAFYSAAITNQTTYQIVPQPAKVVPDETPVQ